MNPLVFGKRIIIVTVQPALTCFGRRDHRMSSRVRVLCCMTVRRTIAAQSHVAGLTRAQMNPLTSSLHALVALALLWMLDRCDPCDMSTSLYSHELILLVLCFFVA